MIEKLRRILPLLFLLLFIGFVGGMEQAENMTVPLTGAVLCLACCGVTARDENEMEV